MMTPEEKARVKIDQMFYDAGWTVVDRDFYSPTITAAAYRFLAYTPMKRILFLVDRNNLGKQAEGEFGMFRLTENGDPFNTIYTVNRLKSNKVPSDSNVVISTIQRLFSLLTGKEITDDDDMTLTELMQTIQQKSDNISKAVSQLQELLKGIEE